MYPHLTLYAPVLLIKKVYFKIIYHIGVIPVTRFRRKTANRTVRDYPVVLNIDGACAPCAAISGKSDKNPSRTP